MWLVVLWTLIALIFLVKIPDVRDLLARWRQMPLALMVACAFGALYLGTYSYSKSGTNTQRSASSAGSISQPSRQNPESRTSSMPTWWVHDETDTDGDGIPDLWEKWTHGNPLVADSDLDRDGDGLTDLEEFWNQTDPRTADTDGDGFSDGFEVTHGMDPLVSEDFTPTEPDLDNDGIIDIWEGSGYIYGFTDSNEDGFDDTYAWDIPNASDANFDIVVEVYTTRSAVLTWGNVEGSGGIVILPTTSTSVKLRLPFRMHTELKLKCAPDSGMYASSSSQMEMTALTSTGDDDIQLWKARIKTKYAARNNPDGNFLDDGDGSFVELVEPQSSVIEALPSDIGSSTVACSIFIENHSCLVSSSTLSGCSLHSEPIMFWCDKKEADHVVSYSWSSIPAGVSGSGMTNTVDLGSLTPGTYSVKCTVACKRTWWNTSRTTYSIASLNVYDCSSPPVILSVYENEWHVPTNKLAECGTSELVYIGFDHAKVKTRNLSRITTGDIDEDITEHCLGVVWEDKGKIDLFSLLGSNYLPYKDDLYFTTTVCTINDDGCLVYGKNPGAYAPDACLVKIVYSPTSLTLDHLWIVVNSSTAETEFTIWLSANMNLTWTLALPRPFSSIGIVSGFPEDPEPSSPNEWQPPEILNSFLHHDARYGMRSNNDGKSGHQATYNSTGSIITSTIAAGTADFRRPYLISGIPNWFRHLNADVKPFVLALQLDGNPVQPIDTYRNLTRPCLYQGDHTDSYISVRPIIPTGVQ